jgi:hypothetical protein
MLTHWRVSDNYHQQLTPVRKSAIAQRSPPRRRVFPSLAPSGFISFCAGTRRTHNCLEMTRIKLATGGASRSWRGASRRASCGWLVDSRFSAMPRRALADEYNMLCTFHLYCRFTYSRKGMVQLTPLILRKRLYPREDVPNEMSCVGSAALRDIGYWHGGW